MVEQHGLLPGPGEVDVVEVGVELSVLVGRDFAATADAEAVCTGGLRVRSDRAAKGQLKWRSRRGSAVVPTRLALNIVFALLGDIAHRFAAGKDVPVTDHDLTADERRNTLAQLLIDEGAIKSSSVEEAFRRLPRHQFLPGVELSEAYGNVTVYTKTAATGAHISAASQPVIVARQLEQLDLQPGEIVFEAGAGTGINAGYMALIVGPEGKVYTSDFDSDIVDGARKGLANAGIDNVEVILGDGALGLPQAAPFNKVIATVGAYEIPSAWLDQLAPGGRIVVPVRLRGTAQRSIAFKRATDRWVSLGSELCVFMPLRGIGDDARRQVALDEGVTLQVHPDQQADPEALATALDADRHEAWTGVVFRANTTYEWMELWLCCTMPNAMMRMNVQNDTPGSGKVSPMFPWGAMATVHNSNLAYLTLRKLEGPDGTIYEVGVIGHGPDGAGLVGEMARQITVWDEGFRGRDVRFEMPDYAETADASVGRFVLDRPHHPITVIWE
ncbi:MAG TPA: methyltransferase, FxLD system [Candidatus Limnocylindrales bacterium]|nr:methyltransferase, FxLD system [Candidatus Limnocylindrales bacterium]